MSSPAPSYSTLESQLLRSSVTRLEAGRDRCRDCDRTPLIGERMFTYETGRVVCELCRTLRREDPVSSQIVHGAARGATVLRVARAA